MTMVIKSGHTNTNSHTNKTNGAIYHTCTIVAGCYKQKLSVAFLSFETSLAKWCKYLKIYIIMFIIIGNYDAVPQCFDSIELFWLMFLRKNVTLCKRFHISEMILILLGKH